ncbi:DUF5050 domain-containing protein [Lachnospiraceae bacterium ZAX-1]
MKTTKSKAPLVITLLIFVLLILLVVGIGLYSKYQGRMRFNDGYVYGNSAGNYYNNGLFCEVDGTVYFSNPFDGYTLYSMTPQGTEATKISNERVSSLNADSNYVYYIRSSSNTTMGGFPYIQSDINSLCRTTHKGKQITILDTDPCLAATLVGNYIYYTHYDETGLSTLYKVKIDGTEKEKLDESPLLLSASTNGNLCYSGIKTERNIWLWNSSIDRPSLLVEEDSMHPIDTQNYIYFMDCANNYRLARIDKATGEKTMLTEGQIDGYNLTPNYVYYLNSNGADSSLCRRSLDQNGVEEVISFGIYCDINVTSNYVYFRSFADKDIFYQTPANGAIDVRAFQVSSKN